MLLRRQSVRDNATCGGDAPLPLLELSAVAGRSIRHFRDFPSLRLSLNQGRRLADLQQLGPDSSKPLQELRRDAHRRCRSDARRADCHSREPACGRRARISASHSAPRLLARPCAMGRDGRQAAARRWLRQIKSGHRREGRCVGRCDLPISRSRANRKSRRTSPQPLLGQGEGKNGRAEGENGQGEGVALRIRYQALQSSKRPAARDYLCAQLFGLVRGKAGCARLVVDRAIISAGQE